MAWWPFGKKKPDESGPGEPSPETPATPPAGEPGVFAPTVLVPPEFAPQDQLTMPVAPPGQPGDPFAAPPGADPFAAPAGDPFAAPQEGDPFAAPAGRTPAAGAKRTAIAPTAPNAGADPFAPGGAPNDFAQTLGDPDGSTLEAPPPGSAPAQADPFAPPPGPDPFAAPAFGAPDPFAAPGPPGVGGGPEGALPEDAHEITVRLPSTPGTRPPQGGAAQGFPPARPVPQPAAAPAQNPTSAAPRAAGAPSEENAMLAKTALSPEKRKLGLALLAGGPITHERFQSELDRAGKAGSKIGDALLRSNVLPTEDEILSAIVARARVPKINLKNTKIPLETIRVIPADVARSSRTLPVEKIGDILVVASPDTNEGALHAVRKATGCLVFPFQCDLDGFDEILNGYYSRLSQSGLAPASPSPDAAPAQATAPAAGAVAAIGADEGEDQWTRLYAHGGPVPAEEVLL